MLLLYCFGCAVSSGRVLRKENLIESGRWVGAGVHCFMRSFCCCCKRENVSGDRDTDRVLLDRQAAVEVRLQGGVLHARGVFTTDAPHPPAVQPEEGKPREGPPEVWGAVPASDARPGRLGGSLFLLACMRGRE